MDTSDAEGMQQVHHPRVTQAGCAQQGLYEPRHALLLDLCWQEAVQLPLYLQHMSWDRMPRARSSVSWGWCRLRLHICLGSSLVICSTGVWVEAIKGGEAADLGWRMGSSVVFSDRLLPEHGYHATDSAQVLMKKQLHASSAVPLQLVEGVDSTCACRVGGAVPHIDQLVT